MARQISTVEHSDRSRNYWEYQISRADVLIDQNKNQRSKGRKYEKLAEKYLTDNGFEILENNYQAGHKEIDIIARKDSSVVFVEVKGAESEKFGHPAEKVDSRKRKFLIEAAEQYIQLNDFNGFDFRFDLITILNGRLEHFPDAFQKE